MNAALRLSGWDGTQLAEAPARPWLYWAALVMVACGLAAPVLSWGAEPLPPIYALVGPTNTLSRAQPVSLGLVLLNPSTEPITHRFPSTLHGRVTSGERKLDVMLKQAAPGGPEDVVVSAAGFATRDYLLDLPEAVEGLVVLEVPLLGVRVGLQVAATSAPAPKTGLGKAVQQAQPPFSAQDFFKEHISGYEPFYFIASTESPNAKFQISLKYQLISQHSKLAAKARALEGIHFAYSQTSLWDWNGPSAPFFDSSYRPEMFYTWERLLGGQQTNWCRLDLSSGLQHESNGKGDTNSRSLNIVYFRPTLTLGRPDQLQWTISPRVWAYLGDLSDNPDLKDYRGYADLRTVVGWARGVQLSALGRFGDDWDRGSVQLDLTYPLMRLLSGSFSVYFHAQYFNGYGESLLLYNEKGSSWRLGFALFR